MRVFPYLGRAWVERGKKINDIIALTTLFSYLNWQHQLKLFHGFLQWYIWGSMSGQEASEREFVATPSELSHMSGSLEAVTPSIHAECLLPAAACLCSFYLVGCERNERSRCADRFPLCLSFKLSPCLFIYKWIIFKWFCVLTRWVQRLPYGRACGLNGSCCSLSLFPEDDEVKKPSDQLTGIMMLEDDLLIEACSEALCFCSKHLVSGGLRRRRITVSLAQVTFLCAVRGRGLGEGRGTGMRALHISAPGHWTLEKKKYRKGCSDHLKIKPFTLFSNRGWNVGDNVVFVFFCPCVCIWYLLAKYFIHHWIDLNENHR